VSERHILAGGDVHYITIRSAATIVDNDIIRADAPEAPPFPFAPGALLALMEPVAMYPALHMSLLVTIWKKGLEGSAAALRVNPDNAIVFEPAGMEQAKLFWQVTERAQIESGGDELAREVVSTTDPVSTTHCAVEVAVAAGMPVAQLTVAVAASVKKPVGYTT